MGAVDEPRPRTRSAPSSPRSRSSTCSRRCSTPSLPLTVGEWEEWGDPLHDPDAYHRLKSWSPYDNVVADRAGRHAADLPRAPRARRASTTRGSSTGSRRSGSRSSVPRTRRTASCSRRTSARATRARRVATTRGASGRSIFAWVAERLGAADGVAGGERAERHGRLPHRHRAVPDPRRRAHLAVDARRARGVGARGGLQPVQPARRRRPHRPAHRLGHGRDEPGPVGGDPARRRVLRGLAVVVRVRGRGPGPLRLHPRRSPRTRGAPRRRSSSRRSAGPGTSSPTTPTSTRPGRTSRRRAPRASTSSSPRARPAEPAPLQGQHGRRRARGAARGARPTTCRS